MKKRKNNTGITGINWKIPHMGYGKVIIMPKMYTLSIKSVEPLGLAEEHFIPATIGDCRKIIKTIMRDVSCYLPIPVREYRLVEGLHAYYPVRKVQLCVIDNRTFAPNWVTIGCIIPG